MNLKKLPLTVDAVVIDLDGTLLHTAPDIAKAANRMLAELQLPPVPADVVATYIGKGGARLIKRLLTGSMDGEPDVALFERAQHIHEGHYAELVCDSQPFPDVVEGLEVMKQAGYRLACITNKSEKFTIPLLKDAGLYDYFELVLSGDSLPRCKPDPLPLLHACEKFGTTPERMLLIGDSLNDSEAARAAGCHFFCVPYGYNQGQPVHELEPDAIVDSLLDATTLIRRA